MSPELLWLQEAFERHDKNGDGMLLTRELRGALFEVVRSRARPSNETFEKALFLNFPGKEDGN